MGYPIPTNSTVDLQRRGAPLDSYGNGTGAYATVATYSAWIERNRFNEPQDDGTTRAADWLLMIPDQVALKDGDRIVRGSEIFEVVTEGTVLLRPGGQIHHTEGRLRPAMPDLRDIIHGTFKDQCTIVRRSEPTFEYSTGTRTPGSETQIYSGPCMVMARDAYQRETDVVMDATTLMSYSAVVPYDVDTVEDDDIFKATATDDGRLLNRELRVVGVRMETEVAGRVLFLEDNMG